MREHDFESKRRTTAIPATLCRHNEKRRSTCVSKSLYPYHLLARGIMLALHGTATNDDTKRTAHSGTVGKAVASRWKSGVETVAEVAFVTVAARFAAITQSAFRHATTASPYVQ